VTVNKKFWIITRVAHDHCPYCYSWWKSVQWHGIVETVLWLAGTGLLIFAGKPTGNATAKHFTKHMVYAFYKFHTCFFLSVLKNQTHCTYVWRHEDVQHKVRTTLRRVYHGCKNLTHMSKTRQVKCTPLFQLLVSRFARLLLFHTAKNRTQRNRRAKGCEVLTRIVARTSSIGGLYIWAGELDILKIW